MKKHRILATAVGAGLALIATASALAEPKVVRVGNLIFKDNGYITPSKLPRHEQAPTSAVLNGRIETADGTHPPAIKGVIADFDRNIQVHAKGLPVCRQDQLVARSSAAVKRACPDAIVGSGKAEVTVSFPEQAPLDAKGPILLFNGGVRGGTTHLFIHTFVNVPAPTAVVATVKLTRIERGHYGMHAVAEVPRIAGGAGSVTKFRLKVDRDFTYKGKKASYLTASCPTGLYYAEGKVQFTDGTMLKVTHVLPCTPLES
jgi:hypothetical protein